MTGLQKIEGALGPDGVERFAAVTCYQGLWLRDHWEDATEAPWWAPHDPDPVRASKPWLDALVRTDEDWFPVAPGAAASERASASIEVRDGRVFRVARATGARRELHREPVGGWQFGPDDGSRYPAHGARSVESVREAMERVFGPPEARPIDETRLDLPRLLVRSLGDRAPLGHVSTPWWRCSMLWGFEEMMTLAAERPDILRAACERSVPYCIAEARMLRAVGARVVWLEDCMADMISPAAYRELDLATLRPVAEAVRSLGMLSVHYYCGRPHDRWDLLMDTGADALALEEGKKGFAIDIVAVADRMRGRMALLGNVDAIGLMEHGSDDDLAAEIARQCEAGRRNRGRFVVSLGSPVTPGTPLARVRQYCDLVHAWSA